MPHATSRYRFEWKILAWAAHLSTMLAGDPHYAFFMAFTEDGRTRKVILGDRPEVFDRKELEALRQEWPSWLFHDPFEGPVYTYVEWKNVDRKTMERLVGGRFEPDDLVSRDERVEFPTSWGVMF
jgi:hypothetical protein